MATTKFRLPRGEGEGEGETSTILYGNARTIGGNPPAHVLRRAQSLRRRQTNAEKVLWSLVRDQRLGGFKFRRQYPVEPYILDFYRDELKLAIELDGGQHALPAGSEADHKRHGFLASRGATVLRFSNLQMLKETE